MSYHLFTSESVSEGHPDKVCDQISDAVLDAYLAKDPKARVACESFAHTGCIHLAGLSSLHLGLPLKGAGALHCQPTSL